MKAKKSLGQRIALAAQVIDELNRINPNPRCELIYHTPYQLLVSVVLSAKDTDMMVNRVMGDGQRRLGRNFPASDAGG